MLLESEVIPLLRVIRIIQQQTKPNKTSSGQTVNEVSNLHCDCDSELSQVIFSQDTPA